MPVQPDTRRFALLSDFAGYVSSSALTALRGAPSGLATLDASGRLPAAQQPVAGSTYVALKTATTQRPGSNAVPAADETLLFPSVPVGTYRLTGFLVPRSASTSSSYIKVRLAGTAVFDEAVSRVHWGGLDASSPAKMPTYAPSLVADGPSGQTSSTASPDWGAPVSGVLVVTTAGRVDFSWAAGSTVAMNLLTGSHLHLSRLA